MKQAEARRPVPIPSELSAPFWAAADQGRLVIQRCASCRRWVHPPTVACPRCGARDLAFEPVSGDATVKSFTVSHVARHPAFVPPYVVAVVELREQRGLYLLTNLPGLSSAEVRIGLEVVVDFEEVAPARRIPQFRVKGRGMSGERER